jgi:hypothetical protein
MVIKIKPIAALFFEFSIFKKLDYKSKVFGKENKMMYENFL